MSAAKDILITFAPPERLRKWLRATWDARTAKGDTVPPEFERWLDRVNRLIDGLPTEADTMTDSEIEELWRVVPTAVVREVGQSEQQRREQLVLTGMKNAAKGRR